MDRIVQINPFQVQIWRESYPDASRNLVHEKAVVPGKTIDVTWVVSKYLELFHIQGTWSCRYGSHLTVCVASSLMAEEAHSDWEVLMCQDLRLVSLLPSNVAHHFRFPQVIRRKQFIQNLCQKPPPRCSG